MLVVFFGKAGVLADHDGLAGVDVLQNPDDEEWTFRRTACKNRQIHV